MKITAETSFALPAIELSVGYVSSSRSAECFLYHG